MDILIFLESEFHDTFDGNMYNSVPHRTLGLLRVEIRGHFQKISFFTQYGCQSKRSDLKSPNLKSESKNLFALLRKTTFWVCGIDIFTIINENTFSCSEAHLYVCGDPKFRYEIYKKYDTAKCEEIISLKSIHA